MVTSQQAAGKAKPAYERLIGLEMMLLLNVHHPYVVPVGKPITIRNRYGEFSLFGYVNPDPESHDLNNRTLPEHHFALVAGDLAGKQNLLVRVHSECTDGEAFFDKECDCREQLDLSMKLVQEDGQGVVVYLKQEGKGLGLFNKARAKALARSEGIDHYDACLRLGLQPDVRDYWPAAFILRDLGVVPPIRLLTNNPDKLEQLAAYGIEAVRVPLLVPVTPDNRASLEYRVKRMGHMIPLE